MARRHLPFVTLLSLCLVAGCAEAPSSGQGQGPGRRPQTLALSPYQELNLGEQAYQEILNDPKTPVVRGGPLVEKVRKVGLAIARAAEIEPLEREINYRLQGYHFEWEFNVLESDEVNAFCLPGGKVGVYTGLFPVVKEGREVNDDQLATVLAHEIAHALAHHGSERLARQRRFYKATEALNGGFTRMSPETRKKLTGLLSAGAVLKDPAGALNDLAYNRQQELEADHIGVFLMTFAGYNPRAAVQFWEKMERLSAGKARIEILSDHPTDSHRIAQIIRWVPAARSALEAYKAGRVAPRTPLVDRDTWD